MYFVEYMFPNQIIKQYKQTELLLELTKYFCKLNFRYYAFRGTYTELHGYINPDL